MSLLASSLRGVNPRRDALVLELRQYLEKNGGPNWRTNPKDLPIEFSDISDKTVLVDVKKADDAWKTPKSVNFRISNTGDNEIGNRTALLVQHIKDRRLLDPPYVYYDPQRKVLDFGDGRHRFALLRDAGVLCIPMNSDSPESLKYLEANEEDLKKTLGKAMSVERKVKKGVGLEVSPLGVNNL
jgi:hypothetical protein